MTERLANLGYLMMKKETTKGTAVVPTVAVPFYSESLFPNINLDLDNPVIGTRNKTYQVIQGQRDHQGDVKVLCEPKTLPHFLNMILTKGTTTNSGSAYTHPYTLGNTQNAYTLDFLKGDMVHRFFGAEIRTLSPEFDENKMLLNLSISALGSFLLGPISSASGTSLTLATDYDNQPGKGLVAGDVLVFVKVTGGTAGSTEEKTISSISADKVTVTLSGSLTGTYTTGDYVYIKAQTPTYTLGTPFNWARTEFRFGDTAAAALTASQTRLERGSKWDIVNEFEDDAGARRSGSYDPAALVRSQGMITLDVKKFFDTGVDLQKFIRRTKIGLVVRHFGDLISGTDYNEFRITFNNLKLIESPNPLNSGDIVYLNQKLVGQYDTSDTQSFDVKIVNDQAGTNY